METHGLSNAPLIAPGSSKLGERRSITVLFSDLSDSTRIAGAMEAEDYAGLLGLIRQIYADVIARHGGEIVRIDGDGVTVIFGYPEAHEDDGRRATEAAVDLHQAARLLTIENPGVAPGIRLHTGINSGLVLVSPGDPVLGRFEILGDATNTAARLSDLAMPDEILVSEATLGSERHFFRTSKRRVVALRGREQPLAVYSVFGREPVENRFAARMRQGLSAFVGRERELSHLDRYLDDSLTGNNHLVVLIGAAGLGKTRLANEFLTRAEGRGLRVHRGYCESYLGARPLQPVLQLLRSIFRIDPTATTDRAAQMVTEGVKRIGWDLGGRVESLLSLLSIPGRTGDGAARPIPTAADAVGILRELFERLAESGPIVVFIDDWQWADDASRLSLDAIRDIRDLGIFVLLATREYGDLEARLSDASTLRLAPLTLSQSEATIGSILEAPEPFMVARIAEYAGGNPLFIEELCHTILNGSGQRGPDSGGAWLDVMIESRFARLPADQASLVRSISVVGHIVPLWLFEDLTGLTEDHPVLSELADHDFIYHGEVPGTLRFKHGITRDAIYRTVGLRERRALHGRVVQALHRHVASGQEDDHWEDLAYHCAAAGDLDRAAHYAELAGDRSMAASALDRAQAQYRAALGALEGMEESDGVVERANALVRKFGLASVVDPSRDQLSVFHVAADKAVARGDAEALGWAEFWLGYIYYGLGDSRKSISHCQRALAAASGLGDDKLAVQVRATLGQAHATACDYEPALALLDEAIAIKAKHRRGGRASVGLAYSISCKAFVLADQGRFEAAYAQFGDAIGALNGVVHEMAASVMAQRSAACLWQGRMSDAAAYAAEAEHIAERVKARYLFSMSRALSAYARWKLDKAPEALRTMVEATAWLEASESQQFLSLNHGWLAEAMVAKGDFGPARRHAAQALLRARQGDRLGEAMALRAMALVAAQGRGRRPAEHYLERAMLSARARNAAHEVAKTQLCAAEIAFAAGETETARVLLEQARSGLASMDMGWFLKDSERLAAVLGRSV